MRITGIAIIPPQAASENPKATPELLAAMLARYSRSSDGLAVIYGKVDQNNPDASIESIFRFVDYGHASIGGLTGGIAIAIDGVSMYLAYKLFYFSQMCDGQESSTRYIKFSEEGLSMPDIAGIPESFANEWKSLMLEGFKHYQQEYDRLDKLANEQPELVRYPKNVTDEKVKTRIRKNYALDRARYFLPFAAMTSVALVMSARMWAETIKQVESLPHPEAKTLAGALRTELAKFSPRLIKHARMDSAVEAQSKHMVQHWCQAIKKNRVPTENMRDHVFVGVDRTFPTFLPPSQTIQESIEGKINRYSISGEHLRRIFVRVAWNNMAVAELRDLNRHRTGFRYTPLIPRGFYLPPEVPVGPHKDFLKRWSDFAYRLVTSSDQGAAAWPYTILCGTQVDFEHGMNADKFIYEVELRTGMGAHFRYAELLEKAGKKFIEVVPEAKDCIQFGTATPE
jgi:hypothetical protein